MHQPTKYKQPFFNKAEKIKVEFGKSSSSNYQSALKLIESYPTYENIGEKHSIVLSTSIGAELELLMQLLKLVKNWTSTNLYINDHLHDVRAFEPILSCYSIRETDIDPANFCNGFNHNHTIHCNRAYFYEFERSQWQVGRFGTFDKKGRWYFNKDEIKLELARQLFLPRICPALDIGYFVNLLNDLPDSIDVANNNDWDFLYPYGAKTLSIVISFSPQKEETRKKSTPIGIKRLTESWEKKSNEFDPLFDDSNSVNTPLK